MSQTLNDIESAEISTDSLVAELKQWGWFLALDSEQQPVALSCGSGHFFAARVFLVIFSLIWTGICVALFMSDAEGAFRVLFSFFGVLCWSALIGTFKATRVDFDQEGLSIVARLGPIPLGRTTLKKRHLVGFEIDSNVTSGSTQYFRIRADSIFGKKHVLANGIGGENRTQALVALLKRWREA